MTSLWFLKRIHGDETYPLNFGDTSFGRDKKCKIATPSVYASRKHCTINVNEENSINVTDCGVSKVVILCTLHYMHERLTMHII